jgi:hypothetical protein
MAEIIVGNNADGDGSNYRTVSSTSPVRYWRGQYEVVAEAGDVLTSLNVRYIKGQSAGQSVSLALYTASSNARITKVTLNLNEDYADYTQALNVDLTPFAGEALRVFIGESGEAAGLTPTDPTDGVYHQSTSLTLDDPFAPSGSALETGSLLPIWGTIERGPVGPDYTQRKGSTFTVTHGLGTAPDSVTINALACTIANATTTTVDVTVDAAITTSGEYDMVIEDTVAVTSETQTVQVNVIGLPAYTLNKDSSALGNLTGVKAVVTATGEIDGTELYSANDLTATAGVMDSGIYPATGEDGDAVTVSILTGAGEGITFNDALELL